MANLITASRLCLLFLLVGFVYQLPPAWQLINTPLLIVIFSLDGVDGYIARKRGEESLFGSVFDVAADRIVENVLWIVLVDLDLVPVWVAIVFISRGFLVDAIRSQRVKQGQTPFGMMRSTIGQWLVSGRFMRFSYAFFKFVVFGWIFLIQPWPDLFPSVWAEWSTVLNGITDVLIYGAVVFCLARGLPVIIEFTVTELRPRKIQRLHEVQHDEAGAR